MTENLGPAGIGRFLSDLVRRASLIGQDGFSFMGKRDLYKALGYDRELTLAKHRARFRRGGIARRIVEAFPEATWRGVVELIEDDNTPEQTPFEAAWTDLEKRLGICSRLRRVDTIAGWGRYAILVIGALGEDPSRPLTRVPTPDAVAFLQPYAEDEAAITRLDENVKSPRFGKPELYTISRRAEQATLKLKAQVVHWTRVVHTPSDLPLEDDIFGYPRLEVVWNRMDDLEKVVGGGAEAFWKVAYGGMQADVEREMELKPDAQAKL